MAAIASVPPIPWTRDSDGIRRGYERFRVTGWIAPGDYGPLRIDVTEPVDRQTARLFSALDRATIQPGVSYTRLLSGRLLWMSDTPDEYRDHAYFIGRATGRVLIHGLGLGCALKAILHKPDVTHVDVVERDPNILAAIGPYFAQDPRVHLIEDDAITRAWPRGVRWNTVWHDIWPDKNTENLAVMATLHRRFGRRCDWQGSWAKGELVSLRRRWGW